MRISAVRFFAATVVALLVIVLTQGTAPSVNAGALATFEPDPLNILDGRTEILTVTVDKAVTQEEIDAGVIDVELLEPGDLSDTEIQAEDADIPAGTTAGTTITVTVTFAIKCVDNKIEGTGENSVAFEIEFGSTNSNAIGSGTVTCSGKAIVIFDPDPLEVPEGSTKKVNVTITKNLTAEETFSKRIHVRLVQPGVLDDTLLDTKDEKVPGAKRVGQKRTVTATFEISCTNNEIRGKLTGTGTDDAELSIEFTDNGVNHGTGRALCVDAEVSQVPSGGSHPSDIVIDPESGYAYALNAFDGAIGVFDGATLIDTINLPCVAAPAGSSRVEPDGFNCKYQGMYLRFLPVGFAIYAADFQAAWLIAMFFGGFDTSSPAGAPEITTIPVGAGPQGIDGDESSGQIYVANNGDGTVSVIDADTDTVTKTINVGGKPWTVKVDSVNGIAYVSNFTLDVVHVIDAATNTEVDTIDVGNGPTGMEIDHNAGTLWVTNFIDSTVSVVDLYTSPLAVTSLTPTTIDLGAGTSPIDISLNEYTGRLYTANANGDTASVINRTTRQVVASIDVGISPDAVAAHGKKDLIYVANHDVNSLSLISDSNPFEQQLAGDLNCDGVVDAADVLGSLRASGALPLANGNECPAFGQGVDILHGAVATQVWGDVNCDDELDGYDPLALIRHLANLPNGKVGCPNIGALTYVW